VIAAGRPEDEGSIRSLGATEVVDYAADVAAAVRATDPEGIDALSTR
jgi:NADPH:quinone reductase-like Zn-dependent oxidoreductase